MKTNKIKIIAEAGINHNGSMDIAKEMIDAVADSGADYVKFQIFNVDKLVKNNAPLANYQSQSGIQEKSQYEMLKKVQLSCKDFIELYEYTTKKNISFLATPFDFDSLELLHNLGMELIKFSSGDLTNGPLLYEAAKLNKKIIISTGMSNLQEIKLALSVINSAIRNNSEITFKNLANIFNDKKF